MAVDFWIIPGIGAYTFCPISVLKSNPLWSFSPSLFFKNPPSPPLSFLITATVGALGLITGNEKTKLSGALVVKTSLEEVKSSIGISLILGIEIVSIVESTTISFGGTRPKKIRRV